MSKPRRKSSQPKFKTTPKLVDQFVRLLTEGRTEEMGAWMNRKLLDCQRTLDFLGALRRRCRKGSRLEWFRPFCDQFLAHFRKCERREVELREMASQGNPVDAIARLVNLLEEEGMIPEDWETAEGDEIILIRWRHELHQRMGEALLLKKLGETARYHEALRSALEAAETCLDRALTLPPEARDTFAPELADMRDRLREKLAEETGL